ncbi:MAG: bifunctional glutamate N-acetyltransferase/amino-acid acetyltransferase ArgJ [Lachnospiraceae bacterium]|nr:bifunctional glutamate N-acetyltransferase/amino-acid acetyltransferase ArgJ [Lachnospiraceae bacterium]MBO5146543.1 bifunctional glutamate N-acetyltransferase/amino-acid acetyltransferase ArgJ [Lachnospiraceae bacterium]
MKQIEGGVTAAKGFEAAGVEANIKYKDRMDMALIYSTAPCNTAGTFTTNVVKAAPVLWDKDIVENSPYAQAVVVNAGIANACTGKQGMEYCGAEAKKMSELLNIPENAVLVGSTGEIGKQLPIDRICAGIEKLVAAKDSSIEAGHIASKAIMTTDTVNKEIAVTFELDGRTVTVGGMSKGSGMIHPNMCTMLAYITTDAAISKELLQEALSTSVIDTYNMISVDGDTSTNDTCLVLANGLAGNDEIAQKGEAYDKFCEALNFVNTYLARKMAGDGEGATALFETTVYHAATKQEARTLAKSVICSSLTKAMIFGHDANAGRILCALGYSGVQFDPEKIDLYFQGKNGKMLIYKDGVSTGYSEEDATKILSEPEVTVLVDMKMGNETATAWGCDLTYDYVKINADYRS